jgi:hypothetical protein
MPVPEPVVDDPRGHRGVVAFQQVFEDLLVQGGVPASTGGPGGLISLAEDRDDVPAQFCTPPGPSFVTARHRRITCAAHCWMPARRERRCW